VRLKRRGAGIDKVTAEQGLNRKQIPGDEKYSSDRELKGGRSGCRIPNAKAMPPDGTVASGRKSILGGLHHEYRWADAA
jgi:hypothetical protein